MSLIDHLKLVTVTHHNLDIQDIANFYVQSTGDEDKFDRLRQIKAVFGFDELQYLETCNRVCFIFSTEKAFDSDHFRSFFQTVNPELKKECLDNIQSFTDLYEGESAVRHLFEMASSMDSLVIGEREIFRQYRQSYESSREAGLTGDLLRILEKATVRAAKDVYNNTGIAEKPLSVVSLAMQALRSINDSPAQRILLIGSGETNTLVGKFLRKFGMLNIAIYNRSIDNAQMLAQTLGANSYHLNALEESGSFDTIIICTSANRVVLDEKLYQKMIAGDNSQKTIIDLAVPRNVSQAVVERFNVRYVDISRLKTTAEKNLNLRKAELDKARPIINRQLIAFKALFHQRQLEKALIHIPVEIKKVKEKAVQNVFADRLKDLDEESSKLLHEMMDYMEKKCISIPLKAARKNIK